MEMTESEKKLILTELIRFFVRTRGLSAYAAARLIADEIKEITAEEILQAIQK